MGSKRNGTRLTAPGVSDNTVSLAVFLALIRAMDAAKIRTTTDLLFVGNVGEEGLGDLRGIKFLMQQGKYKDRIKQVIAVDNAGTGESIVNGGTGSKRYRVTFNGPGGHSYSDFGLVNPAFAMGAAIQKFSALKVPSTPKTTFNVGVVSGGTSVNSIPLAVSMEVDMRSDSPLELEKLETAFLALVKQTVDDENRARSTASGVVAADVNIIGNRPSGQTPPTTPLVQAAVASARAAGLTPRLGFSSTDANLPISLGGCAAPFIVTWFLAAAIWGFAGPPAGREGTWRWAWFIPYPDPFTWRSGLGVAIMVGLPLGFLTLWVLARRSVRRWRT